MQADSKDDLAAWESALGLSGGSLRAPCVVVLRGPGGAPGVVAVGKGEVQEVERRILDAGEQAQLRGR